MSVLSLKADIRQRDWHVGYIANLRSAPDSFRADSRKSAQTSRWCGGDDRGSIENDGGTQNV
jgi:hypothetical protein